jgi:hypothetical protein
MNLQEINLRKNLSKTIINKNPNSLEKAQKKFKRKN